MSAGQESSAKRRFGAREIIGTLVTLAVLVIVFAVIFPQFASYRDAWDAITSMSTGWIIALIAAALTVILIYVWPFQAALPGLGYRPGFMMRQTSFMIGNSIPGAGGAISLGVQYAMLGDYGYGAAPATAAIGITAVWNSFMTLGLPVLGVLALVITGHGDPTAWALALIGLIVVGIGIGLFAFILRSQDTARRVGELGNRVLRWLARLIRKEIEPALDEGIVDFRSSTIDVIGARWHLITGANLLQQLSQFAVLFVALSAIQVGAPDQVTLLEAFAAFAFARLLTFIPLTPGGLGTVDAALAGILSAFGASNSDALAAVLVWRAATYFPQIFIGIGTFLGWRRQRSKRARMPA